MCAFPSSHRWRQELAHRDPFEPLFCFTNRLEDSQTKAHVMENLPLS